MNEFASLSALLDEMVPVVEPEEPAWEDVLARAGRLVTGRDRDGRRQWSARRRRSLAVLAVAGVAVAASALAATGVNPLTRLVHAWHDPASNPGPLEGTYSASLSGLTQPELNGHWTITFAQVRTANGYVSGRYGTYVIRHDGKVTERGRFEPASGLANLSLRDTGGPARCPDSDTGVTSGYQVIYDDSALKLTAVVDRCSHRRIVLSSNLFMR